MDNKATILILAAGLGTRMSSRKAKVLHEAGGLALVEHVVRAALTIAPADRVVVVTGHQAEKVESLLAGRGLRFARQTEQKGTGHAVEMCREVVPDHEGRLLVLNGDGPLLSPATLTRLVEHHDKAGVAATVVTTELVNPAGYGRCIVDAAQYLLAIVEDKVATPQQKTVRLINSGMYCFDASLLWEWLHKITPNPVSGEYYLTDIAGILNAAGHKVSALLHPDPNELLGINTRVDLAEVEMIFRLRKANQLMLSGVTILRPDTVSIDPDVNVGMDSVIEPFAHLTGKTVVGENCRIGAGAIVSNSLIADDVDIAPYTLIHASVVESGASIGPFARLRTDNFVGAGSHIGNFVELKKTRFGEGVKAGHLAYLGDSEIGAGTNIGAGTITCNYDGDKKHKTIVGEKAFLGSNSTLVAPVEVGNQAYVAAGSVITDGVPPGALGLGRGRQVNKEGWVAKRKATTSSHSQPVDGQ
ncbi:MAG: bifunctional UDP-N-acetylglucosamine diphosphorylase/glucosamine-1-phosphate N-acetyltransferase GlmU [Bryobacteraceae bacterium]|nr:bifunctional UDP-N-acetylglucosamine diphosphorylase/glucosamine-1-phosphate N-acetyltransferase GlmU [Bryobacteraceae bacterium]